MIYIGLGSNLGNRLINLQLAAKALADREILKRIRHSIVLETEAILPEDAPNEWNKRYLNMVISGDSELSLAELLDQLKLIEKEIGRPDNYERWSPRIIDLDILLYNNEIVNEDFIKIPHKEVLERNFLIHLIATMDPVLRHPITGETFLQIASKIHNIQNCFTNAFALHPKIVGIVNVTPDSFSDGGDNFNVDAAKLAIRKLHEDGASVIELGAQSTRPNATTVTQKQELDRLLPVLDAAKPFIKANNLQISIDSFYPDVILKILEDYKIAFINDVTGNLSKDTLKKIAKYDCGICSMHSVTVPASQETIDLTKCPVDVVLNWANNCAKMLKNIGFVEDKIIIDAGIGFGKNFYQNSLILNNLSKFSQRSYKLMIGHSRKSFIGYFSKSLTKERDLETSIISNKISPFVDYIRVHNVQSTTKSLIINQLY